MARITTYTNDTVVQGTDRLLGTDANGNGTRNFTVSDLQEFINTGTDVLQTVWNQIIPTVTQAGDALEISQVRTVHTTQEPAGTSFVNNETGFSIILIPDLNDNDRARLAFTNYNSFYHIPSFVGKRFTATTNGATPMTYTGTIDSIFEYTDGRNFDIMPTTNSAGQVVDYDVQVSFNVTFLQNQSQLLLGQDTVDTLTIDTAGLQVVETEIIGRLSIDDLFVSERLQVGEDGAEAVIELHGDLNIPDVGDSIVLGDANVPDRSVSITNTSNGPQLTTPGEAGITVNVDSTFNNPSNFTDDVTLGNGEDDGDPSLIVQGGDIQLHHYSDTSGNRAGGIIRTFNPDGTEGPNIGPVVGNGTDGDDEGLLTSLQVGQRNWHLPTASSSVAQVIPGLLEELVPSNSAFTTGAFFYGVDRGSFVDYHSGLNTGTEIVSESVTLTPRAPLFPVANSDVVNLNNNNAIASVDAVTLTNFDGTTRALISPTDYTVNLATGVITFVTGLTGQALDIRFTETAGGAATDLNLNGGSQNYPYDAGDTFTLPHAPETGTFSITPSVATTISGSTITFTAGQTATLTLTYDRESNTTTPISIGGIAIPNDANRISITDRSINNSLVQAFEGVPSETERLFFIEGAVPMSVPTQNRLVIVDGRTTGIFLTGLPFDTQVVVTDGTVTVNSSTNELEVTGGTQTDDYTTRTTGEETVPLTNVTSDPLTTAGFTITYLTATGVTGTLTATEVHFEAATVTAPATRDDIVDGTIYEVTVYDAIDYNSISGAIDDPGLLEFTRIGLGDIVIASSSFTVDSSTFRVRNIGAASPNSQNVLLRDPITGNVTSNPLTTVSGAQAQVRYCETSEPDTLTNVSDIIFEGSSADNGIIRVGGGRFSPLTLNNVEPFITGGVVTVDNVFGTGAFTSSISVDFGDLVPLGPIAATQQVQLPAGQIGASIRFVNASTFDLTGATPGTNTTTGEWQLIPATGETFLGQPTLELNDRTANFDLVYINGALGWAIID